MDKHKQQKLIRKKKRLKLYQVIRDLGLPLDIPYKLDYKNMGFTIDIEALIRYWKWEKLK